MGGFDFDDFTLVCVCGFAHAYKCYAAYLFVSSRIIVYTVLLSMLLCLVNSIGAHMHTLTHTPKYFNKVNPAFRCV